MYDHLKDGDTIAVEKYTVTSTEGEVERYTLTLKKRENRSAGNDTCMTVHADYPGARDRHFDTHYCAGADTPELFHDWSFEWLKEQCRPDSTIERLED